jgi:uncharacterized protein YndB with AHSA1/START domain
MLKKLLAVGALLVVLLGLLLLTARGHRFEVVTARTFEQPPAAVWQLLATPATWTQWWPGLEAVEAGQGLRPGAPLGLALKGLPERSPAEVLIVAPERELAWRRPGVLGSYSFTRFALRPVGTGTELTMSSAIVGPQAVLARATGREEFTNYHNRLLQQLAARLAGGPAAVTGTEP